MGPGTDGSGSAGTASPTLCPNIYLPVATTDQALGTHCPPPSLPAGPAAAPSPHWLS